MGDAVLAIRPVNGTVELAECLARGGHHRTRMEAFCGIYCCQFGTPNVTKKQAVTVMAWRVVGGLLMRVVGQDRPI